MREVVYISATNDIIISMSNEAKQFDLKVVTFGGGSGQFTFLRGAVRINSPEKITAVAGPWDSGGISGEQRVKEGILPPGDYIQCLLGLMEDEEQLQEAILILRDRSEGAPLTHLLAAKAEKVHHGVEGGIDGLRRLCRVRGNILLSTIIDTDLHFETRNGIHHRREHELDRLDDDPTFSMADEVSKIFLVPNPRVNRRVLRAVQEADEIVFPPGSPYGSTFPHLLIDGLSESILEARGKLVLVLNLMTTQGQDHHLDRASRWLNVFQYYLGDKEWIEKTGRSRIDYLVVNDNHIDQEVLEIYLNKGQKLVKVDEEECELSAPGMRVVPGRLAEYMKKPHLIRHKPQELARTVLSLA